MASFFEIRRSIRGGRWVGRGWRGFAGRFCRSSWKGNNKLQPPERRLRHRKKQANVSISCQLGDNVRIKNDAGKVGKIVEYRGALGPGGAPVYRVQVKQKPNISDIELLGTQLEIAPRLYKKSGSALSKTRKPT